MCRLLFFQCLDYSASILCKQTLQPEVENRLVSYEPYTRYESWEIERAWNTVDMPLGVPVCSSICLFQDVIPTIVLSRYFISSVLIRCLSLTNVFTQGLFPKACFSFA